MSFGDLFVILRKRIITTRKDESMYWKSLLVLVVSNLVLGICLIGTEVYAQSMKITAEFQFGCTDREYIDKITRYAMQGDRGAFDKAIIAGERTGICTKFNKGEEVFLASDEISSSRGTKLQKLRRKGETKEYWTIIWGAE